MIHSALRAPGRAESRRVCRAILIASCLAFPPTAHANQERFQPMPSNAPTQASLPGEPQLAGPAGTLPGADVIYNHSSLTGFYIQLFPGEMAFDSGQLPSPSFPGNNGWGPGCAQQYTVTGIEFGYCTDRPAIDIEIALASQYDLCNVNPFIPVATLLYQGLPGSGSGAVECFVIRVDLRSQGPTGPFTLLADGDGDWDPFTSFRNVFGARFRFPNATAGTTGLIFSGTPAGDFRGARWSILGVDYSLPGNGCYNYDTVEIEPGDYCLGGGPGTGPYLRLFADACGTLQGQAFCTGDGSATACPCANHSPPLNQEGCRSSVNGMNGGRLEVTGVASLSADTTLLRALRLPDSTSALFFQGTTQVNGGAGQAFGDGLRCAGGSVIRLGAVTAVGGQVEYPSGGAPSVSVQGAITSPGTRTYQVWYRNSADFCTAATFNLTNGWTLDWSS